MSDDKTDTSDETEQAAAGTEDAPVSADPKPHQYIEKERSGSSIFFPILSLIAVVLAGAAIYIALFGQQTIPAQNNTAKLTTTIEKLTSSQSENRQKIEDLNSQIGDLKSELAAASNPAAETQQNLSALKSETSTLKAAISALAQKVEQNTDRKRPELDGLVQQLGNLRKKIETLSAVSSNSVDGAALTDVTSKISALTARVEALHREHSTAAADRMQAIKNLQTAQSVSEQRMQAITTALEKQIIRQRQDAIGLALTDLDRVIANRESAEKPLAQLQAAVTKIPALKQTVVSLNKDLTKPLASLDGLNQDFQKAMNEVGGANPNKESGIWARTWQKISGLVRIRRTGDIAGTSDAAILARAEVRLKEGKLEAAIGELSKLSDPAKPTFAPWLTEAKRRLRVLQNLQKLRTDVIAQMAGGR